MFNRTVTGLINKFLFYPEPIVWVEGEDDFPFYEPLRKELSCRILNAGGKLECKKLAEAVIDYDYPFVVIMDGDFEILENDKNPHKRVLLLKKYSIENYLFEKAIIQSICSKYIGNEESNEQVGIFFDEVEADIQSNLYDLVVLDVANYKGQVGISFFPDSADSVLNMLLVRFLPDRINPICEKTQMNINEEIILEARRLVGNYIQKGRFIDLVRGHFIFGIIRHLLISCTRMLVHKKMKEPRRKRTGYLSAKSENSFSILIHAAERRGIRPSTVIINIDNVSLLIMLSLELWNKKPTEYHKELDRDIRLAITDAIQMKPA